MKCFHQRSKIYAHDRAHALHISRSIVFHTADLINADLFKVHVTAVEHLYSGVPIIQCAKRCPRTVISLKLVMAVLTAL